MADNLAKEAIKNKETIYNKLPKSQVVQQVKQQSIEKWQNQWDQTTKGLITKQFFPNIKERLRKRIHLTPNLTAIVTAHGKTKDYLHRFKIIESSECPCRTGNQSVDHLIYECPKLQRERDVLKRNITKQDKWSKEKSELMNKYLKCFIKFTNSIDLTETIEF